MRREGLGERLTIYVGESDQHGHTPLYIELVQRARHAGLAGATVVQGIEGFGAAARLRGGHRFRLSSDAPVAVVVVDERDRIEAFLDEVGPLIDQAPLTIGRQAGDQQPGGLALDGDHRDVMGDDVVQLTGDAGSFLQGHVLQQGALRVVGGRREPDGMLTQRNAPPSLSGVIGVTLTFAVTGGVFLVVRQVHRRRSTGPARPA